MTFYAWAARKKTFPYGGSRLAYAFSILLHFDNILQIAVVGESATANAKILCMTKQSSVAK